MGKKIVFKTAAMIRGQQGKQIPEDVTKKIDDWIKASSQENNFTRESETVVENLQIKSPFIQESRTVRLNINISINTHKEIKKICADKGLSITEFVTHLLQKEIGI